MAETSVVAGLTERPIDLERLLAAVERRGSGAVLLFVGTVRDVNEGRAVTSIRYDAYREMAQTMFSQIVSEAAERAAGCAIEAIHRLGELQVGDPSVAIAVSTPHRAEAFDVCRYIIEQVKVRLPVWKHERYEGGDSGWVAGVDPSAELSRS